MTILDTHAWVWWVNGGQKLSRSAKAAIRSANALGVSVISVWEVALLVCKGRLRLSKTTDVWVDEALSVVPHISLLPLTPKIAITGASLRNNLNDPADCILVATALDLGCAFVSADERIGRSGLVRVVW